jgi:hypothetical protein
MPKKSPTKATPVPAHALIELEMRVAVEFFDQAADSYADHSFSEFELPATPARRELVTAAMRHFERSSGNDAEELFASEGTIVSDDCVLFHYFAQRWGALMERLLQGQAITPPLAQVELLTVADLLEYLARNDFKEYAQANDEPDHGLPATPEARQLAEAVIRHQAMRDASTRVTTALSGEFSVDVHATWLLAYLAARCRALAETSPAVGHPFDGVYRTPEAARSNQSPSPSLETASNKLPVIERPGVSPKWLRAWKKFVQDGLKGKDKGLDQYFEDSLLQYATQSFPNARDTDPFMLDRLARYLGQYASRAIDLIQQEAIDRGRFDPELFVVFFTGNYFAVLMDMNDWVRMPLRSERLGLPAALTAALGMALGCKKEARSMAKALILAHRIELFRDSEFYPASQCVLQIFASYLALPPLMLKGEAAVHPIYKALAAHWRHPDADALAPLMLAACDEHTHRNTRGKPYDYSYDFMVFARTPVEILLIFKLREELGLANPNLDHPLMNTALGQLPREVTALKMDDVMAVAITRARAEGFDEEKVLAELEQMSANVK